MKIEEIRTLVTAFLAYMKAYVSDAGSANMQSQQCYGKRFREVAQGVISSFLGQEWFAGSAHQAALRYLYGNLCANEVMIRICQVILLDNAYQQWLQVTARRASMDPERAAIGHRAVLEQHFLDALENVTVAEAGEGLFTSNSYWPQINSRPIWKHILETAAWDGQLAEQIREVLVLFGLIDEAGEHCIGYQSLN